MKIPYRRFSRDIPLIVRWPYFGTYSAAFRALGYSYLVRPVWFSTLAGSDGRDSPALIGAEASWTSCRYFPEQLVMCCVAHLSKFPL